MSGSDGDARREPVASLLILTFTTGLVDAVSLLGLGRVFTANMTGNVVLLGFAVAGAAGFSIAATLTSLLTFLVGAAVAGRIGRAYGSDARDWLRYALIVETTLVAVAAIVATLGVSVGEASQYIVIGLLAFAMGARNAAVRALGVKNLNTTVLTMTLTGLAADSKLAGGSGSGGGRQLAATGAMLIGALIGGILVLEVDVAAPLFVAAALAAISVRLVD